MYKVREATGEDAAMLATRLRPADYAEIKAGSGRRPLEAMLHGVTEGLAYVAQAEEGLIGIYGVVPNKVCPEVGHPWMMATPLLTKYARKFIRDSKPALAALSEGFELLWNVVDARNTVHVNFIKRLGFELVTTHPYYGFEKRPFIEFRKYV